MRRSLAVLADLLEIIILPLHLGLSLSVSCVILFTTTAPVVFEALLQTFLHIDMFAEESFNSRRTFYKSRNNSHNFKNHFAGKKNQQNLKI